MNSRLARVVLRAGRSAVETCKPVIMLLIVALVVGVLPPPGAGCNPACTA